MSFTCNTSNTEQNTSASKQRKFPYLSGPKMLSYAKYGQLDLMSVLFSGDLYHRDRYTLADTQYTFRAVTMRICLFVLGCL